MKKRKKKICLISSSGGHLEQIKQLDKVTSTYDCFYVTTRTKATESMIYKKYLVRDMSRKNKATLAMSLLMMFIEQIVVFLKEKPDIIITTGAGVAIPMCFIGKVFMKKIVYIESYARINTPNKSGRLIYKVADLFIVQWEQLLKHYPKATYGGKIY